MDQKDIVVLLMMSLFFEMHELHLPKIEKLNEFGFYSLCVLYVFRIFSKNNKVGSQRKSSFDAFEASFSITC